MIDPSEYDDIVVTVAHPWSDLDVPLPLWIERGPWPRPLVAIRAAKRRSTGESVPMSEIPLEFHNSRECRELQRQGRLRTVWGPPPEEGPRLRPPPDLEPPSD